MNYLQLCQTLASEAGVNGTMTTIVGLAANTELGRIARWVREEWRRLQGRHHWSWMWEEVPLTLPAGTNTISGVTQGNVPADRWNQNAMYQPVVGSDNGDRFIEYFAWDDFKLTYPRVFTESGVTSWSVAPDNSLRFNSNPIADTDFVAERWALPTTLVADADEPEMPEDLHDIIWMRALVRYANFDEAGVQRSTAIDALKDMMQDLYTRCLPSIRLGGSMLDDDH